MYFNSQSLLSFFIFFSKLIFSLPSSWPQFDNADTPEAVYIQCKGDTVRGLCAQHLLFLLLRRSSRQTGRKHCVAVFPPGRPLCSPSTSTASCVLLSTRPLDCAPGAEWTLACCGSGSKADIKLITILMTFLCNSFFSVTGWTCCWDAWASVCIPLWTQKRWNAFLDSVFSSLFIAHFMCAHVFMH